MVKPQNGSWKCLPCHFDRRVKYLARQNDTHFGSITVGLLNIAALFKGFC